VREDLGVGGVMVGFSQWEREWLLFELMGWLKQLGLTSCCYLSLFCYYGCYFCCYLGFCYIFFWFSGLGLLKLGCSKFI
jgi:hypothetical protein